MEFLRSLFVPQDDDAIEQIGFRGNFVDWLETHRGARELERLYQLGMLAADDEWGHLHLAHRAFDTFGNEAAKDGYASYRMRFGPIRDGRRGVWTQTHPATERRVLWHLITTLRDAWDADDPNVMVATRMVEQFPETSAEAVAKGLWRDFDVLMLVGPTDQLGALLNEICGGAEVTA